MRARIPFIVVDGRSAPCRGGRGRRSAPERKDVKYGDDSEEVERRKKYDKYSVFKLAYELYSAMYKEKLKCGTKTIVE